MGSLFQVLLSLAALLSPGQDPARTEPAQRGAPDGSLLEQLATAEQWPELCKRDARTSFGDRSAALAVADLERRDLGAGRRAVALLALGASGAVAERARLSDALRDGTPLEQRAAVLALGLVGALDVAEVKTALDSGPPHMAECVILSLLLTESPGARRFVEGIANDAAHRLSPCAQDLLVFSVDRNSSRPGRASSLYLRLRYEAARRYGLIDGESWTVLRLTELCAEPAFLREVVLRAAARLDQPGVADHLLVVLRQPGATDADAGRLRAAVSAMPREVADLVDTGLWRPASAIEWAVLVDEIEKNRLERLTKPLLRAALEVRELRFHALTLLVFAGEEDALSLVDVDLAQLSVDERVDLCTVIGTLGDAGWLERIDVMREDPGLRVRLAYQVAALRCGNKPAAKSVAATLDREDQGEHAILVDTLCRVARDLQIAAMLDAHLGHAEGDERLKIASTLCYEGRIAGRSEVRTALLSEPPPTGGRALRLIRALGQDGSSEDAAVLRRLFPCEGNVDVNVELALALVQLRDPLVAPILRAAIWRSEWNESCLAAALLARHSGARALRELLMSAPDEASSNDLRRLGFAIGEWGGSVEVELLQRDLRFTSGHPALQGALLGLLAARTR